MPERQEPISRYATRSDISPRAEVSAKESCQWGEINVFWVLKLSWEHSDQEERKGMNRYKNLLFFSILLCLCAASVFHHILCAASSHFNTNKWSSNHGKYSSLLLMPSMSPSSLYPPLTFLPDCPHSTLLAFLYQGLFIKKSGQLTHLRINVSSRGVNHFAPSNRFIQFSSVHFRLFSLFTFF